MVSNAPNSATNASVKKEFRDSFALEGDSKNFRMSALFTGL
jgi:hypothetical protein